MTTLACEYLARLGYRFILGARSVPRDEDDPRSIAAAKQAEDEHVLRALIDNDAEPRSGDARGARWLIPITWPDRVPGLITWSGQQTLAKIIRGRQVAIRWETAPREGKRRDSRRERNLDGADPMTLAVPMLGATGIDARSAPTSIEAGFSVSALGMHVEQRPALELLAIIGLETVPIVSFAARECGFVADGVLWRFAIEARDGDYYHRWGELREADWSQERKRWRELDRLPAGGAP